MTMIKKFTAVFAMVIGLFAASTAMAGSDVNTSSGMTTKGAPLAVHGYDVVAYHTKGEPTFGTAKHSVKYKNATYRFASQESLDTFNDNPEKYVPTYGGYCAFGVSVGAKFVGNPRRWKIVDGKLYLNLNEKIREGWLKDIPGNIEKADKNWKKISHKTPQELS